MKYIILHILSATIICIYYMSVSVSANECSQTCSISDAPAPALTQYLVNLETAIAHISNSLSSQENDDSSESLATQRDSMLSVLSSTLSFERHF